MNVTISGRPLDVTDALKRHVQSGLGKGRAHVDRVSDLHVGLSVEKNRHQAELNLHADGRRLNAKDSADDMDASGDGALHKLIRQVSKHKERITDQQHRAPKTAPEAEYGEEEPAGD